MEKIYLKINNGQDIPVYKFGSQFRVLLIAGVHGNEKTGVLLLQQYIKVLKQGAGNQDICIIPVVNKAAYKMNTRENPVDDLDLNRIFPIKNPKTVSEHIAKSLQDFSGKFDVIIDLHVFTGQKTLTCGVELGVGDNRTQMRIRSLMSLLSLEAVCRIDHSTEPKKDGSLCAYLQAQNKLAFGIEYSDHTVVKKHDYQNFLKALNIFMSKYKRKNLPPSKLRIYKRNQFFSKADGYFEATAKPGTRLKKGDHIGTFMNAHSKTFITAFCSGILLSVRVAGKVAKQQKLFVVGT